MSFLFLNVYKKYIFCKFTYLDKYCHLVFVDCLNKLQMYNSEKVQNTNNWDIFLDTDSWFWRNVDMDTPITKYKTKKINLKFRLCYHTC